MIEELSPEETLEREETFAEEDDVQLTAGSHEEVMEVIEVEKLELIIALKEAMERAEGRQKLLGLEEMVMVAFSEGMANKRVFKKIGFTPEMAEVLEGIAKGTHGLGDLDAVWEI